MLYNIFATLTTLALHKLLEEQSPGDKVHVTFPRKFKGNSLHSMNIPYLWLTEYFSSFLVVQ